MLNLATTDSTHNKSNRHKSNGSTVHVYMYMHIYTDTERERESEREKEREQEYRPSFFEQTKQLLISLS